MIVRKALCLGAALALAACADAGTEPELDEAILHASEDTGVKMVPFKARQSATQVDASAVVCAPGEIASKGITEGTGTHLGHYTGVTESCAVQTSPLTLQFTRVDQVLVAANGDELWTSMDPANPAIAVITDPTPPLPFTITGGGIVTGGTGRFTGATGYSTSVTTGAIMDPGPNQTTAEGWISAVGSIK